MEWYDVFNKGVPSDKGAGFTLDVIGDNCSTNDKLFIKRMTEELMELNDIIHRECKVRINIRNALLAIVLDSKTLEQALTFSSDIYLFSILNNLDIKPDITSEIREDEIFKLAKKRIKELSRIRIPNQLQKEFPTMYEDYLNVERTYKDMEEMRKRYLVAKKIGAINEDAYNHNMKRYKEFLSFYGFEKTNFNFKTFIENMVKVYNNLLKPETYDMVTYLIASCKIDMSKFDDCLDKESFELLVAASYLNNAYQYPGDGMQFISYLAQYFKENEDKMDDPREVQLYLNDEPVKLNRISLYKRYKEYLIEHPEVKIVRKTRKDFEGKSYDDIVEYLSQFKGELEVSWDILPSGENIFERFRSNESSLSEEEKQKRDTNKERILQEKEDFFNNNKPYLVLKGKNAFLGYIGYIYPNAYVVLEKFFKNAKGTSIAEDAIYIMKVEEFLDLSVKSKPEIIENHLCQRVTHHRGWQGKVEDILKKAITEDSIERVQIFENQIKSLKN